MRVAIIHHWFVTRGGGERVAECIAALFPQAEIFTLISSSQGLPASFAGRTVHTSFLQWVPFAASYHRHMMPLYPMAAESLDLRGFDLVLSSDSGPIKGVRLDPGAIQICFCHSPMRYLWDSFDEYRASMGWLTRTLFTATAGRVRRWDVEAASRVTHFIANSNFVASRIQRFYGRPSTVIYPPIDLHRASLLAPSQIGSHYLAAGRLVAYKRTDLMIEACRRLGRELRIVGSGPAEADLRKIAGPNVTFLGELSTQDLWQQYAQCRALLFAANEDFGMVPLEAQACGRPVIAYGAGGSLETIRGTREPCTALPPSAATGVYFDHQTADSLVLGMQQFECMQDAGAFQSETTRAWAEAFATPVFLHRFHQFVLDNVPGVAAAMIPEAAIDCLALAL